MPSSPALVELIGDNGVLNEKLERYDTEGVFVRCFENYRTGCSGLLDLKPAGSADTPAVTWFQTLKSVLRHRSGEIVTEGLAGGQKCFVDDTADCMDAEIVGAGIATAIAEKAGHWIAPAGGEGLAKNIFTGRFLWFDGGHGWPSGDWELREIMADLAPNLIYPCHPLYRRKNKLREE